jgi:imidazolonepropionase-like amidohydrolase
VNEVATQWTVVTADRLVLGTESDPIEGGVVVIRDDTIHAVGHKNEIALPQGPDVRTMKMGSGTTVLPGMVDVHTHLVMPGDGTPYQTFMQHSDGLLLLQAAKNARTHLLSGVTTVTDTGARGTVTFTLRDAIHHGLLEGPRLVLCGRPITRTGGHCWFLGAEADGADEISQTARQLLKEGADIIKVMATGGGTIGTIPYRPSYFVDELSAAVTEAHANGKKTIAHVSATEGIKRALDAKIDVIFHAHFYTADGALSFQQDVARRIADAGVEVNPTLYVNGVYVERLQRKAEREGLDAEEQAALDVRATRYQGQMENVGKLIRCGVKLVAGSDAGWGRYQFGDLVTELEQMVRVGMSPSDAVVSATSRAAGAIGVGDQVGSLASGKKADLLAVRGNPTEDISALRNVEMVMLNGRIVRQ